MLVHLVDRGRRVVVAAMVVGAMSLTAMGGARAATIADSPATRLGGADRYSTAALIAGQYAPGVPAVYVATGKTFPDALSAGAAAGADSPVVLVAGATVPSAVSLQVERLHPDRVVLVGGPAAVPDSVGAQLGGFAVNGWTRLWGPNRFATAASVSAATFAPGVPVAYVATGANFPDALTGAALGAVKGGPVLLTTRTTIPDVTKRELARLQPEQIVVLGGDGAVSTAVSSALAAYGPVSRVQGSDRYATNVAANAALVSVPSLIVSTGSTFPDALAGAALAGHVGAAMALVGQTLGPAQQSMISRLHPSNVIVLGGQGAVSDAVVTDVLVAAGLENPPARAVTFGDGTHRVGIDIPPGTYRTRSDAVGCYWERLSGFSGSVDDIVANNFSNARQVVTISSSDAGFKSEGCGTWTNDLSAVTTSTTAPFGDGMFIVGTDIAPGTYRTRSDVAGCYWERLSDFSGEAGGIIANNIANAHQVVTIDAADAGFVSLGCGTWTRDLSAITTDPTAPFGEGTYIVGTDIAPGTWTAPGGSDCYWARLVNFSGEVDSVIANDVATTSPVVTIDPTDVGFESSGCGTWHTS